MTDIAASVLAKLKNKAKSAGISYQQCLQLFFQEEFLRKQQTAIWETLQNRGTVYEKDSFDRILALMNNESMQIKWRYFMKTLGNPEVEFGGVMENIQCFLEPVWNAILSDNEFFKSWNPAVLQWEDNME